MLARENRLTTREGFRTTVRRGRRRSAPTLVTHRTAGPGTDEPPRAGFVVSKAVGTSVTRNRVQRRLRHLVRHRIGDLAAGDVLVVRALPRAADASSAQLAADLDRCLGASSRETR